MADTDSCYSYDSADNRQTQTDARGVTTQYGYDALNRLTSVAYPDATLNVAYTYDLVPTACAAGEGFAVGRLSGMTDGSGSTQYCYDPLDRLTETRDGPIQVAIDTYGYDKTDNRTAHATATSTSVYGYPTNSHRLIDVICTPEVCCLFERQSDSAIEHMEQLAMENHNHFVFVDKDARELIIFRVSADGEKSLLTKAALPMTSGWSAELETLAKTLGENLLMDSPAVRQLLEI